MLSEGVFYYTNFSKSNLENVDLRNSIIRMCNLSECNMKNVNFGKLPDLREHTKSINCIKFIKKFKNNQYTLVSGSNDKSIKFWDIING